MLIRVNVQPYVWKYLRAAYGPDPYCLQGPKKNELKLRFQFMRLFAEVIPQEKKLPGAWILLDIGEDAQLSKAFKSNQELLKLGHFFQAEFFLILRKYVEAQRSLAQRLGLPPNLWNQKRAIELFLSDHGIEPFEYDEEALYRQVNRIKNDDLNPLREKLIKKYGFCQRGNELFQLPRLSFGSNKLIYWHCYSRERGALRRYHHRIPAKLIKGGDWLSYAKQAQGIISDLLLSGYNCK